MKNIRLANQKLEKFLKSKRMFKKFIESVQCPGNNGCTIEYLENDCEYDILNSFIWHESEIELWSNLNIEYYLFLKSE